LLAHLVGHISLAAHTQREFELIERMRGDRDHLSADRVLSGPGLATLYQAIEESERRRVEPLPQNEVLTLRLAASDRFAAEALAMFVTWLGAFCR
jgi:glucokinase